MGVIHVALRPDVLPNLIQPNESSPPSSVGPIIVNTHLSQTFFCRILSRRLSLAPTWNCLCPGSPLPPSPQFLRRPTPASRVVVNALLVAYELSMDCDLACLWGWVSVSCPPLPPPRLITSWTSRSTLLRPLDFFPLRHTALLPPPGRYSADTGNDCGWPLYLLHNNILLSKHIQVTTQSFKNNRVWPCIACTLAQFRTVMSYCFSSSDHMLFFILKYLVAGWAI